MNALDEAARHPAELSSARALSRLGQYRHHHRTTHAVRRPWEVPAQIFGARQLIKLPTMQF